MVDIIDFEEFKERKFAIEEDALLRARDDALIALVQRGPGYANFVYWAVQECVDHVRSRSKAVRWPYDVINTDPVKFPDSAQFIAQWVALADEIASDFEAIFGPEVDDDEL